MFPKINKSDFSPEVLDKLINSVEFKSRTDAPWWLRILMAGSTENYFAYGTTVYIPPEHSVLATSADNIKVLATGKILPPLFFIHHHTSVSLPMFLRYAYLRKYKLYYHIFEWLLLKTNDHPMASTIYMGRITSIFPGNAEKGHAEFLALLQSSLIDFDLEIRE